MIVQDSIITYKGSQYAKHRKTIQTAEACTRCCSNAMGVAAQENRGTTCLGSRPAESAKRLQTQCQTASGSTTESSTSSTRRRSGSFSGTSEAWTQRPFRRRNRSTAEHSKVGRRRRTPGSVNANRRYLSRTFLLPRSI